MVRKVYPPNDAPVINSQKPSAGMAILHGIALLMLCVLGTEIMAQEKLTPTRERIAAADTLDPDAAAFEWFSIHTIKGIQYDREFVTERLRQSDQKLTVFGYYRLFTYARDMAEYFPGLPPYERAFSVGDGYREPMLSLNVVGRPTSNTSFGTELFFFTPYLGTYREGNEFTTNLGINFYGNFRTDHGKFGIRAGGIHWYNLSPFTIGLFQVLDRFSIFDRTPWEGVDNTNRYDNYFRTGVAAPGDLRWDNQAFQGLIINGAELPGEIGFDLFWGRTQPQAGLPGGFADPFQSIPPTLNAGNIPTYNGMAGLARSLPSVIFGGKLVRSFGPRNQKFAYNTIRNVSVLDSISNLRRKYEVHTLSLDLKVGAIGITGELGAGSFSAPNYAEKWGEALMLRFSIPKSVSRIPLDVQVYQISPNFFNQSGEIFTNSNPDILESIGLLPGAVGAGGQITMVNQLVHNRRGVNINTGFDWDRLKVNAGWGIAQELTPMSTILNFVHRINGLAISRIYNPFPADATGPIVFGPYDRLASFFRGFSEVVQTTDIDGLSALATNRKYFNSVDLQAKYNSSIFDKALYFFYLGSFGSVEEEFSFIPSMHEKSYLFVQYHEIDIYYEVLPKFILTGYLGIENARGGRNTDWGETNNPRDQLGTGIGVGFDWAIAPNSGLYVRHRWMQYEDRSFLLDRYKGRELTIELKTFF